MSETHGKFRKDIVGERFGRLTVIRFIGNDDKRESIWLCRCDCGEGTRVRRGNLISGRTKSCGCLVKTCGGYAGVASTGKRSPEYSAWRAMKYRCENDKGKSWDHYGGRGIKVCEEWRNSFNAFLRDVGHRPGVGYSLDRIDVNGNYEPGNVRWATGSVQAKNRRDFESLSWKNSHVHAYRVVKDFETVLSSYTGAPYVVTADSCTAAILIACAYLRVDEVEIPKRTYCSVPQSIIHAGGTVKFRDEEWIGSYQLKPYPIYDCARHMTSGMYIPGTFMCLSFHWTKHLPIGRGGAILCDDKKAAAWMRRARFDGRKEGREPKNDPGMILGWHAYLTPPHAAQGLMLMASMNEHNDPLPNSDYPDLSLMEAFR